MGDVLAFVIFLLCRMFSPDNKQQKGIFKPYINFVLEQLKENRIGFIINYFLLGLTTVTVTLLAVILFGLTIKAFTALFFCYCLVILTFVDAKTQFLPDIITKPLIIFGVIQGYFGILTDLRDSVMGAIAGYLILWAVNSAFRIIKKKDGMGYGDFKLLSAIAAWVGIAQLPFLILSSSIIGIFVALLMARFADNKLSQPTPFGPSLAIAGLVSLFWGSDIMYWYLSLYSY